MLYFSDRKTEIKRQARIARQFLRLRERPLFSERGPPDGFDPPTESEWAEAKRELDAEECSTASRIVG